MNVKGLDAAALSIRSLSMDAIQKAKSGHPGMPLGCAELAAMIYGEILNHNPNDPSWINRDRFVLSGGHGSMLLYSALHLSGYDVTLDDIKNFRQLGSKCPGHPEYGITPGVDATTGPLGQGIAMAVGMAMAETMLAQKFNTKNHKIIDHYTYVLLGEGCLMEGVSSEASSLAGHLKLGKLIVFYDENRISIDGSTDITFTEDVAARYKSYGWQVLQGSMYDYEQIASLVEEAKKDDRPSFIMLKSEIGKGAPTVVGKSAAHGAPLGDEGVKAAKEFLGLPLDKVFYVSPVAYDYFASKKDEIAKKYNAWQAEFNAWASEEKELKSLWDSMMSGNPVEVAESFPSYTTEDKLATRAASGAMLQVLEKMYPGMVGGSADLEGPNSCKIKSSSYFTTEDRTGRNVHFGIREFAMAVITNGLYLHGGLKPFCATFLVFADYMKPAIRLASLMKLPIMYIFTHDSIYVGEDGPTHQPIETITSLRTIPGVQVLRPGDAQETELAWLMASESKDHPVCIMLTRQNLPVYEKADPDWKNTIRCGAYVAYNCESEIDVTILATGSEVSLAIDTAKLAKEKGKNVRVLSVLDRELFASQPVTIKDTLIGNTKRVVTLEAGIRTGWEQFVKTNDDIISIDTFGTSAPFAKVAEFFGFTSEKVLQKIIL